MKSFILLAFIMSSFILRGDFLKYESLSSDEAREMLLDYNKWFVDDCDSIFDNNRAFVLPYVWNMNETSYVFTKTAVDTSIKAGYVLRSYTGKNVSDIYLEGRETFSFDAPEGYGYEVIIDGVDPMLISCKRRSHACFIYGMSCCRFGVSSKGEPEVQELPIGLDRLLLNKGIRSVTRIEAHQFLGRDVHKAKEYYKPVDIAKSAMISEVDKDEIRLAYAKELGARIETIEDMCLIPASTVQDESLRVYVSSERERDKNNSYKWTLLEKKSDGFSPVSEDILIKSKWPGNSVVAYMDKTIHAKKDAFFMIYRDDFPPYLMATEVGEGRLMAWDYLHHENVAHTLRMERGSEAVSLEWCHFHDGLKMYNIMDIFYICLMRRLERIPCIELHYK